MVEGWWSHVLLKFHQKFGVVGFFIRKAIEESSRFWLNVQSHFTILVTMCEGKKSKSTSLLKRCKQFLTPSLHETNPSLFLHKKITEWSHRCNTCCVREKAIQGIYENYINRLVSVLFSKDFLVIIYCNAHFDCDLCLCIYK